MDKNYEEKIAKMAFGELSEAEAAEVKAHAAADVDAAKALASYELMRSDLRSMKDVPPDQLSKERLQNAILGQGLKPKPVRRPFPFAWVTSVAAVALVGFVMFNGMKPNEQVAMNTPPQLKSSESAPDLRLNLGDGEHAILEQSVRNYDQAVVLKNAEAPKATPAIVPISQKLQSNSRSWSKRGTYHALTDRDNRPPKLAIAPLSANEARAVSLLRAPSEPDTLVLINNDKDSNTGASTAVEVKPSEAEDVVISS